jgi:hypothetical protein
MGIEQENISEEKTGKGENVKENKEKMAKEKFERYIELIKQGELFFFKDAYMELIDLKEKEKEKKIKELKDANKNCYSLDPHYRGNWFINQFLFIFKAKIKNL